MNHVDPAGEPPWAMQLAVDVTNRDQLTANDVFAATAAAAVTLCDLAATTGRWQDEVERWERGLIRKIVRRAKNTRWDALNGLDGTTATHGTATVRAFAPSPVDEVPPALAKAQVSGLNLPDGEPPSDDDTVVVVHLNPAVQATTGKMAAQVAHAAHLAYRHAPPDVLDRWRTTGFTVAAVRRDMVAWEQSLTNAPLQIQDRGLTEIPPGTITVAAAWH